MSPERACPLNERRAMVLGAIVQEHVETAAPVGSRVVREQYGVEASTATIRNDMCVLEREGYIHQPHTSAGRVPRDKGYRVYVDSLMPPASIKPEEETWVRSECRACAGDGQLLYRAATRMLSQLTCSPALLMAPPERPAHLLQIRLSPVSADLVRLVYETDQGGRNECILQSAEPLSADQVAAISRILSERFTSRDVTAITLSSPSTLVDDSGANTVPEELLDQIKNAIEGDHPQQVFVDGAAYALDYPEYQALDKLKPVVRALDDDGTVRRLLRPASRTAEVSVTIGHEHHLTSLQSCSLVARHYVAAEVGIGALGIMGPTRLDYLRAVAAVRCIAEHVSRALAGR
ncbi:MAG: heat-inducible transcription repressor HrcA [Armatimonadetes bacterium]|nr:heat-inducible transcription repressor HrcA [Armatimonadota bacterium]